MSKAIFGALVAGVAGLALVAGQPGRAAGTATLFEGARLITGDGSTLESSAFIVENGRIVQVGAKGRLRALDGAARVDLTGKTVMPALIDLHVHVGYRKGATFSADNYTRENILDQLNRFAYYGVAAVLSTGTERGDLAFELRDTSHPGARLRTTGRGIAAPDGGPNPPMRDAPYGVTTEVDVWRDVRELAAKKVEFVKIWVDDRGGTVPKLGPALYKAAIDEAHRHNVRVIAHIATLNDVKDLVRAGIDGFAHTFRDRDVDDELLGLLKARPKVFFMLTLWAPRLAAAPGPPTWLGEPLLAETAPPDEIRQFGDSLKNRDPKALAAAQGEWTRLAANVAALNRAGVRLALGTDVGGNTGRQLFGWTEHIELENMVAAGLTPSQAIVAATRTPAEILGLEELGTIAAGKSADFLVLDANPLADITNTRKIHAVYMRGAALARRNR